MKIENVTKKKSERKIIIGIRVNKNQSKWLKEKNLSPTKIFNETMKELGYKE